MTAFIFILIAIFLLGAACGFAVWFALRQRQPISHQQPTETSTPPKALPFRWSYIIAPVATLILSAILAALFYPYLPAEVGYHFKSSGAPDRWLSREAAVALMLVPQFFLTLLGGGITWGITRLGTILLQQPEALGIKPQRMLSFIGNIAALPQFALGFTMLNIFSYNVFQILILPTWIFLLILGLSTIALGVLPLLIILKARGQLFHRKRTIISSVRETRMTEPAAKKVEMEKIVSLCRRRGFIFPSSEIYGGLSSCWDYGPLGVELKRNIKEAWWRAVVRERDDIVGLDTSILMHPQVWEASGHLKGFSDPLVECKQCHLRWRKDELKIDKCPSCGGELTEPRMFNLMFKTFIGPVEDEASVVYLRPETAQGIFVNFDNVVNTTRKRLPFGIAQIGKAFRNEITTGNFIFRSREFEQMEIEFFVKPETDEEWFKYWTEERLNWYVKLGIKRENLRLRQHGKEELAHYARRCSDIDYLFPMGWAELEGIANRGDFDLRQHASFSGKGLNYFDEETKEHIVPHIIEPSAGVDRSALAFLCDAYDEDTAEGELRAILRLHPSLAPIKVAVLPLSRRENLTSLAKQIDADLRQRWMASYDDAQSIGRRYRRQDEIGTPFCVTVDFQSLEDEQVTIRERDSMNQIRVPISELKNTLQAKLEGEDLFVLPPGGKVWKMESAS